MTRELMSADILALVEAAGQEDLVRLIGELEAAKALAWAHLTFPAPDTSASSSKGRDREALLNTAAAAALLGVPDSYVGRLARQRRLPCVRLGKYVRFEPEAIRDLVARSRDLGGVS